MNFATYGCCHPCFIVKHSGNSKLTNISIKYDLYLCNLFLDFINDRLFLDNEVLNNLFIIRIEMVTQGGQINRQEDS